MPAESLVVAPEHIRALRVEAQALDEDACEERDYDRRDERQHAHDAPGR